MGTGLWRQEPGGQEHGDKSLGEFLYGFLCQKSINFGMLGWEHVDESNWDIGIGAWGLIMGMGAWGRDHGDGSLGMGALGQECGEFFLVVFVK